MEDSNQKSKTVPWGTPPEIDPNMKDHSKDPFVLESVERAKEFLRLHPIPNWMLKKYDIK